jgi:hypothetical protein
MGTFNANKSLDEALAKFTTPKEDFDYSNILHTVSIEHDNKDLLDDLPPFLKQK